MKKHIVPALIVIIAFAADLVTKNLALRHLGSFSSNDYNFLGGILKLDLTFNQGGVFGIMQGHTNFFLIVSIIVLVIMIAYYFYEKQMPGLFRISMALIIGGAAGNIFDRIIPFLKLIGPAVDKALPGRDGVVDFISVGIGNHRWPTFNIADSVIIAGALLLVLVVYLEDRKKAAETKE